MAAVLVYLCGRNRALSDVMRLNRNQPRSGDFEDSRAQYLQNGKHMPGMTMVQRYESGAYMHVPPALPGYGGHDSAHSLPRTQYAPSDALTPANPVAQGQL
jgi:hypothetical protein